MYLIERNEQIWLESPKNATSSHKIENNNYVLNDVTITKTEFKSNYLWHYTTKTIFTIMASIFCRITREGSLFGGKKNHVLRDLKMTRFAVKISPYFELWF